jgi:uncharacterized protein YkwD
MRTSLKKRGLIIYPVNLCLLAVLSGCYATGPVGSLQDASAEAATTARCIAPEEADRLADQVLQLINLERASADLPPVVINPKLAKIAGDYACRMVEERFFGHEDPINGRGPGNRAISGKYAFHAIGENLAAGQQTPAEVMKVWMESSAHRAVILDDRWREVGVAVREGGEYGVYWVQEFGDPATYPLTAQAR